MRKYIAISFVLFSFVLASFSQNVTNVKFEQEGQKIRVNFNISGVRYYQSFNTELWVSTNGGRDYIGPLKEVRGDVGLNQEGGSGKVILWDVYKEMPDFGGQVVFDVKVNVMHEKVPRAIYLGYRGSLGVPVGAVVGLTGKIGFYVSARTNFGFFEQVDYTTDGELVDYPGQGFYSFTGENQVQNLTITAGLSFQLARSFHIYAGAGYGLQNLLWEIEEFDYPETLLGSAWAKHTGETWQNVELETGVLFTKSLFFFSAGVAVRNLNSIDVTIGVGLVF